MRYNAYMLNQPFDWKETQNQFVGTCESYVAKIFCKKKGLFKKRPVFLYEIMNRGRIIEKNQSDEMALNTLDEVQRYCERICLLNKYQRITNCSPELEKFAV